MMTEVSVEFEFRSHKEHVIALLTDVVNDPNVEKIKNSKNANEFARLFTSGILFSLLLNTVVEGAVSKDLIHWDIDSDVLHKCLKVRDTDSSVSPEETKVLFNATHNLNKFIECARKSKIIVVNISAEDILEANLGLIFGLIQQIVRLAMFKSVNLLHHPELIRLMEPQENVIKFISLADEELLIRWVNWHLKAADSPRRIKSLSREELKDGVVFLEVLRRVVPDSEREALDIVRGVINLPTVTDKQRLAAYIKACKSINCKIIFDVPNLLYGDSKYHSLSLAVLFNKYTGIHIPSEEEVRRWQKTNYELERKNEELMASCNEMKLKLKVLSQSCEDAMDSLSNIKLSHSEFEFSMKEEERKLVESLEEKIEKCAELENKLKEREQEHNQEVSKLFAELSQLKKMVKECSDTVYTPELSQRISVALTRSQLSVNFNQNNHPSQKAPTPTESPVITTPDKDSSESIYNVLSAPSDAEDEVNPIDKCTRCISSMYPLVTRISEESKDREKKFGAVLEKLERLTTINNLTAQKIYEYTESRMHIKKK